MTEPSGEDTRNSMLLSFQIISRLHVGFKIHLPNQEDPVPPQSLRRRKTLDWKETKFPNLLCPCRLCPEELVLAAGIELLLHLLYVLGFPIISP